MLNKTLYLKMFALLLVMLTSWYGPNDASAAPVYDRSFAIENETTCLGCHASNTDLVDQHARSAMTHVMVKCNACHGTHTESEVGNEKPNITGFYPGIGVSGYMVGDDRCLVCHADVKSQQTGHPVNNGQVCKSCHTPHVFGVQNKEPMFPN